MRTRRQLASTPLQFDRSWQTDMEGDAIKAINFRLAGNYTSSAAGLVANESVFGYLGQVQVVQDGETILDVDSRDLRHLSAFLSGGYNELQPTTSIVNTTLPAPGPAIGSAWIPFDAFLDGAAIDASRSKVVVKGRFRPAAYLGTNVTAIAGDLTIAADTALIPRNAKGEASYYLPNWTQQVLPLSIGADLSFTIRPKGERLYLPGMLLRQFDASLEFTNANVARTDGLIRKVWVVLTRGGRKGEVARYTWGELKQLQNTALVGFSRGDSHTGVAYLPLRDDTQPGLGEILILEPGDSLEVHVDTSSPVEYPFSTAADAAIDNVVANGDQLFCSVLGHVGRGPAFSAGSARRTSAGI